MGRLPRVRLVVCTVITVSAIALSGCPADSPVRPAPLGESTASACADGADNDEDRAIDCADSDCQAFCLPDGARPDVPRTDGGFLECARSTTRAAAAFAPTDVIWAVDTSGSMVEEAGIVQENLNGLSSDLVEAGVQTRLVLITGRSFVEVPAPLADDPERFLHVAQPINSREVFSILLSEFDRYSDLLRPDGPTHIVVVTDDDDLQPSASFLTRMEALLGHGFVFHAIASEEAEHDCRPAPDGGELCRPGCEGPFGAATAVGTEYYDLASETLGMTFSVCSEDWSPLFDQLRERVRDGAVLPCRYTLPTPPIGETFDRDRVNVQLTEGGEAPVTFRRASGSGACGAESAWYYDNPESPTQVLLCPAACDQVEGVVERTLQVVVGCESQLI